MLVDLRDRIIRQARIADAARPSGTPSRCCARPAARSFAGDFIVADADVSDGVLSVVVVDVSGKGVEAGTRSLLLSGAFGGLLGRCPGRAVPARRQRVPAAPGLGRGLRDRDPPRTSTWSPATSSCARPGTRRPSGCTPGPARGRCSTPRARSWAAAATPSSRWSAAPSQPGDALMLYTDGLVEDPRPRHPERHRQARRARPAAAPGRLRGRPRSAHRRARAQRRRPGAAAGAPALAAADGRDGSGVTPNRVRDGAVPLWHHGSAPRSASRGIADVAQWQSLSLPN